MDKVKNFINSNFIYVAIKAALYWYLTVFVIWYFQMPVIKHLIQNLDGSLQFSKVILINAGLALFSIILVKFVGFDNLLNSIEEEFTKKQGLHRPNLIDVILNLKKDWSYIFAAIRLYTARFLMAFFTITVCTLIVNLTLMFLLLLITLLLSAIVIGLIISAYRKNLAVFRTWINLLLKQFVIKAEEEVKISESQDLVKFDLQNTGLVLVNAKRVKKSLAAIYILTFVIGISVTAIGAYIGYGVYYDQDYGVTYTTPEYVNGIPLIPRADTYSQAFDSVKPDVMVKYLDKDSVMDLTDDEVYDLAIAYARNDKLARLLLKNKNEEAKAGLIACKQFEKTFQKYGEKYKIDWKFLRKRAYQETFCVNKINNIGATGIMQVMPDIISHYAGEWKSKHPGETYNATDPSTNVEIAAMLIRDQYDRWGDWVVVDTLYHMGDGNFDKGVERYLNDTKQWTDCSAKRVRTSPGELLTTCHVKKLKLNIFHLFFKRIPSKHLQVTEWVNVYNSKAHDYSIGYNFVGLAGGEILDIYDRSPEVALAMFDQVTDKNAELGAKDNNFKAYWLMHGNIKPAKNLQDVIAKCTPKSGSLAEWVMIPQEGKHYVIRPGTGMAYIENPNVNIKYYRSGTPSAMGLMLTIAKIYFEKTGKKLELSSLARDWEYQKKLVSASKDNPGIRPVKKVDRAHHPLGVAVDLPYSQFDENGKKVVINLLDKLQDLGGNLVYTTEYYNGAITSYHFEVNDSEKNMKFYADYFLANQNDLKK